MISWSTRRRLLYGSIILLPVLLALFFAGLSVVRSRGTCTDGIQNGGEAGIDCGGSCTKRCELEVVKPTVLWSRIFPVSGDVYTAVAYVDNQNRNLENKQARYMFRIYDDKSRLISSKEGVTTLLAGKRVSVFEFGLIIKNGIPKKADFEFVSLGPWTKPTTPANTVSITNSVLLSTTTTPRIEGAVRNTGTSTITNLELSAFVLDNKENVVGASRTFVDSLAPKQESYFSFTWPRPFALGTENCPIPLDVLLAVDTSASLYSTTTDTGALIQESVREFLSRLGPEDRVSLFMFKDTTDRLATFAPASTSLSLVSQLMIATSTKKEETNLAKVFEILALEKATARPEARTVAVVLTDGLATLPRKTGSTTYTLEQTIASAVALGTTTSLYMVSAGPRIETNLLSAISGDRTLQLSTKNTLVPIYTTENKRLCQRQPVSVQVNYR